MKNISSPNIVRWYVHCVCVCVCVVGIAFVTIQALVFTLLGSLCNEHPQMHVPPWVPRHSWGREEIGGVFFWNIY